MVEKFYISIGDVSLHVDFNNNEYSVKWNQGGNKRNRHQIYTLVSGEDFLEDYLETTLGANNVENVFINGHVLKEISISGTNKEDNGIHLVSGAVLPLGVLDSLNKEFHVLINYHRVEEN